MRRRGVHVRVAAGLCKVQFGGRQRPANEVSLRSIAPELLYQRELLLTLNAFGYRFHSERASQRHHRLNHDASLATRVINSQLLHERFIDLYAVDRQLRKVGEA